MDELRRQLRLLYPDLLSSAIEELAESVVLSFASRAGGLISKGLTDSELDAIFEGPPPPGADTEELTPAEKRERKREAAQREFEKKRILRGSRALLLLNPDLIAFATTLVTDIANRVQQTGDFSIEVLNRALAEMPHSQSRDALLALKGVDPNKKKLGRELIGMKVRALMDIPDASLLSEDVKPVFDRAVEDMINAIALGQTTNEAIASIEAQLPEAGGLIAAGTSVRAASAFIASGRQNLVKIAREAGILTEDGVKPEQQEAFAVVLKRANEMLALAGGAQSEERAEGAFRIALSEAVSARSAHFQEALGTEEQVRFFKSMQNGRIPTSILDQNRSRLQELRTRQKLFELRSGDETPLTQEELTSLGLLRRIVEGGPSTFISADPLQPDVDLPPFVRDIPQPARVPSALLPPFAGGKAAAAQPEDISVALQQAAGSDIQFLKFLQGRQQELTTEFQRARQEATAAQDAEREERIAFLPRAGSTAEEAFAEQRRQQTAVAASQGARFAQPVVRDVFGLQTRIPTFSTFFQGIRSREREQFRTPASRGASRVPRVTFR